MAARVAAPAAAVPVPGTEAAPRIRVRAARGLVPRGLPRAGRRGIPGRASRQARRRRHILATRAGRPGTRLLGRHDRSLALRDWGSSLRDQSTGLRSRGSSLHDQSAGVRGRSAGLRSQGFTLRGRATGLRGRATSLRGRGTSPRGRATGLRLRGTGPRGRATSLRLRSTGPRGRSTSLRGRSTSLRLRGIGLCGRRSGLRVRGFGQGQGGEAVRHRRVGVPGRRRARVAGAQHRDVVRAGRQHPQEAAEDVVRHVTGLPARPEVFRVEDPLEGVEGGQVAQHGHRRGAARVFGGDPVRGQLLRPAERRVDPAVELRVGLDQRAGRVAPRDAWHRPGDRHPPAVGQRREPAQPGREVAELVRGDRPQVRLVPGL
nr:hypothetical protein GCM10020092_093930 [Actinoplanes digitatis]